jgi:hypothetical protein
MRRSRSPFRRLTAAAMLVLMATASAQAQPRVQLAIDQAPYYAGVPLEVQLTAEGFDETPQPEIDAQGPAAKYLRLTGVSPNVNRSVRVENGQITQTSSVRFVFSYKFTPPKPGRYQIGPFRVTQGSKTKVSGLTNVNVESVPVAGGQRIGVVFPRGDIFVGQRIPIKVEWWVSPELRNNLYNPQITIPMLDLNRVFSIDSVTKTDAQGKELRSSLVISLSGTAAEFPAKEEVRHDDGVDYVVRTVELIVVPLSPGAYEFEPPSVTVDQAIRWRRDLFGSRVPTQARKIRAVGQGRTLRILDVPTAGRPSGFAGAVGTGFTIDVAADRSVVQVGDPITLTITLRGSGSIESASLPNLIGNHGLAARDFRVVRKPTAGQFENGEKRFEAVVRVANAQVREIPPIEYAWFDPQAAEFRSFRSRPIALSVKDAQVVGAGDVVRNMPDVGEAPSDDGSEDAAPEPTPRAGSRRPTFTLTGADLAIEQNPAKLIGGAASGVWQWACYGLGLAFLGLGIYRRSRGEIDPDQAKLHKALADERKRIAAATSTGEIADCLRRMAANATVADRAGLEAILADCDARSYARSSEAARVTPELRERALGVAASLTEPRA